MTALGESAPRSPRLGRYELITQIGHGGMAEVQLALQRGPAGFEKLVVVKLVHENLATQKAFVDMLLDEARVAALVKHPNVVDIYDLGEVDGRYFIAMEYLEGEPLLAVLRAGRDGRRLDVLSTARLIADTAEGLDAAHELRSMGGEPIELVHHDVSLGNIVVLYNGQVKLVDFGVAKATQSATARTRVQGKFSYMAPEKLRGGPGDRRSDIWSLGCVLWEALTLRRLFKGGNDTDTMKQVLESPILAPSRVNGDVPADFDAIALRALDREPAGRYATAKAMATELEDVLRKHGYAAKNDMIAKYMQATFESHIAARKKLLQEVSSKGRASPDVVEAAFHDEAGERLANPSGEIVPMVVPPEADAVTGIDTTVVDSDPRTLAELNAIVPTGLLAQVRRTPSVPDAVVKPSHAASADSTSSDSMSSDSMSSDSGESTSIDSTVVDPNGQPPSGAITHPEALPVADPADAAADHDAFETLADPKPVPKLAPNQISRLTAWPIAKPASKLDPSSAPKPAIPPAAKPAPKPASPPAARPEPRPESRPEPTALSSSGVRRLDSLAEPGTPPGAIARRSAVELVRPILVPSSRPHPIVAPSRTYAAALPIAGGPEASDSELQPPASKRWLIYPLAAGAILAALVVTSLAVGSHGGKPATLDPTSRPASGPTSGPTSGPASGPTPEAPAIARGSDGSGTPSAEPPSEPAHPEVAPPSPAPAAPPPVADPRPPLVASADPPRPPAPAADVPEADLPATTARPVAADPVAADPVAADPATPPLLPPAPPAPAPSSPPAPASAPPVRPPSASSDPDARTHGNHRPPPPHVVQAAPPHVAQAAPPHVAQAAPPHVAQAPRPPAPERDKEKDREKDKDKDKVEKINPSEVFKTGLQAWVRGDTKTALATYKRVLQSNPEFAPAWRGVGLVYEKLGDKSAAHNAFQKYLQLAPGAFDAAGIRARLESP
ncbi:MAG TPA: tetratricopeptide repeat protein [Kofleriaceae bacterium]|nr:tetratricopeptide repeat protein [Kofleriaceae bacterium]